MTQRTNLVLSDFNLLEIGYFFVWVWGGVATEVHACPLLYFFNAGFFTVAAPKSTLTFQVFH